jgi:hypothetical protein
LTGEFCYEETRGSDGLYDYTFEATDGVGNTVARKVDIFLDTVVPEVEVIGVGTNYETRENSVQLRGRLSPNTTLTVNGTPVAVVCNPNDPSGWCDFDLLLPVEVGQSTLTMVATDRAGNTQVRTFNILRTAPEAAEAFDYATPTMVGALLAGLALFAMMWARTNAAALEAHPGLGGTKGEGKRKKKEQRKQRAAPQPEVIYEVDPQAMYSQDVHARPPPRPPR